MVDITKILQSYPKTRPPLPVEQRKIYEKEYLANRQGDNLISSLSQKLESWMHKEVTKHIAGQEVLEIGAGTLNHMPYLAQQQITCDIIEPMTFLYENSEYKSKVRHFYHDISECSERYDTIHSIAVLEHVIDLPKLIATSCHLLKDGGTFVHAIPCESGFLWGLSWRCSTGLSYYLRTGHSYKNLMRHEHVNTYDEILALNKYFFESVKVKYFPIFGKHISLYACIIATQPKLELAKKYL